MFTGIVETVGTITEARDVSGGKRLRIDAGDLARDTVTGASICVSGVCLTVTQVSPPALVFDVIAETLEKSTLVAKQVGDAVNLERSLRVGDRLDGHFVQGHVEGTARVTRVLANARERRIWLEPEPHLQSYLIPKGSVCLDGVSLTLAEVAPPEFCVALIPTTLEQTTLASLRVGARVNLETDLMVRTIVHRLALLAPGSALTLETLKEAGFL